MAPDESYPDCEATEEGWEIQCRKHDWHKAVEFNAANGRPAVIKCTGRDESVKGGYCDVRIPLDVAKRKAGVS